VLRPQLRGQRIPYVQIAHWKGGNSHQVVTLTDWRTRSKSSDWPPSAYLGQRMSERRIEHDAPGERAART
jgi:hypothetical protein